MVSAPAPPSRIFEAPLPFIVLLSSLPVPLIAATPVKSQVLEIGAKREADRGPNRVRALARVLGHHVADIVHDVGVIAQTADHGVGARAAVEDIRGAVANYRVVVSVAGSVDRGDAGQSQVLEIGAEREADRGLNCVGSLARRSRLPHRRHCRRRRCHRPGRRSGCPRPRRHRGCSRRRCHLSCCPAVAGSVDRGDAGEGQVLDIGAEREADRGQDRVRAFARVLRHRVARVVDQ